MVRFMHSGFHKLPRSNAILRQIRAKIESTGPITVAAYMREALSTPFLGYYMKKDVFGEAGDFITSPEISQIFGELVGVWFCNEWFKLGMPKPLQFVEFGPGRGTLADDVLRVFSKILQPYNVDLSVHLIEMSPYLQEIQQSKLCESEKWTRSEKPLVTHHGYNLTFHRSLESVPDQFSVFLAQEFLDALPIHKFQKTEGGWREVLIDCKDQQLEFVLSRHETPAASLLIHPEERRSHLEVCPEAGVLIQEVCRRMNRDGGVTLVVDYGHDGTKSDTFRGFQEHRVSDPLREPGHTDLTADVDFSYLRRCVGGQGCVFGPVSQSHFLKSMGIDVRLQRLLQSADPDAQRSLMSGCRMLLDSAQMGERFKFLAVFPAVLKTLLERFPPPAF